MKIAKENVTRRRFLSELTVGAAGLAAAAGASTYFAGPRAPHTQMTFKGNIPDTPYNTGHIRITSPPTASAGSGNMSASRS